MCIGDGHAAKVKGSFVENVASGEAEFFEVLGIQAGELLAAPLVAVSIMESYTRRNMNSLQLSTTACSFLILGYLCFVLSSTTGTG